MNTEWLKAVRLLSIKSKRRVSDLFSGEYSSYFRGSGIEFEEFRDYVPGDDVRRIDWMVTARRDRPYVRQFKEERERTLYFLVDASASMFFGSQSAKRQVAAEIVAMLSLAASRAHDKISLIVFTDRIEYFEPPKRSQSTPWKILEKILSLTPSGKGTSLEAALNYLMNVSKRRGVVILLSDFLFSERPDRLMRIVSKRHECAFVRIRDKLEGVLPKGYLVNCRDLESGSVGICDTNVLQKNVKLNTHIPDWIPAELHSRWIDIHTHEDVVRKLVHALGRINR